MQSDDRGRLQHGNLQFSPSDKAQKGRLMDPSSDPCRILPCNSPSYDPSPSIDVKLHSLVDDDREDIHLHVSFVPCPGDRDRLPGNWLRDQSMSNTILPMLQCIGAFKCTMPSPGFVDIERMSFLRSLPLTLGIRRMGRRAPAPNRACDEQAEARELPIPSHKQDFPKNCNEQRSVHGSPPIIDGRLEAEDDDKIQGEGTSSMEGAGGGGGRYRRSADILGPLFRHSPSSSDAAWLAAAAAGRLSAPVSVYLPPRRPFRFPLRQVIRSIGLRLIDIGLSDQIFHFMICSG